jgi:hypothetical protein
VGRDLSQICLVVNSSKQIREPYSTLHASDAGHLLRLKRKVKASGMKPEDFTFCSKRYTGSELLIGGSMRIWWVVYKKQNPPKRVVLGGWPYG